MLLRRLIVTSALMPLLVLLAAGSGLPGHHPAAREWNDVISSTAMKVSGPPAWLALPVITLLVAVILTGPAGRCFRGASSR
jgi:hypothetical protein